MFDIIDTMVQEIEGSVRQGQGGLCSEIQGYRKRWTGIETAIT